MLRGKGIYKSTLTFQNGWSTGKAKLCKFYSPHAAEVCVCGMEYLTHGTACQEFPQACSLGSGRTEAVYNLLFGETEQFRGGGTGGKSTDYRSGMPVLVGGGVDGFSDAGTGLIACGHCLDHLFAAQMKLLRKGKGSRHGDDGQMGDGSVVNVVHIHDVAKYRVQRGGLLSSHILKTRLEQAGLGSGYLLGIIFFPDG